MLNIHIVRHGQTDYNKKRIVQGSGVDSSLNSVGLKQAQMFYDVYKNAKFEKIYVSPLTRTLQTILLFEKIMDKVEYSDALKEISWGVHEGKRPTLKMKRQFDQMLQRWEAGETHLCVKEGESPDVVANRLNILINKIKTAPENNILLCSHGRTIRILLCLLQNKPISEMGGYLTENLAVHRLTWDRSGPAVLVDLNNKKHLES